MASLGLEFFCVVLGAGAGFMRQGRPLGPAQVGERGLDFGQGQRGPTPLTQALYKLLAEIQTTISS